MPKRIIKDHERILIEHLLRLAGPDKMFSIPTMVEDLNDGGMGSIQLSRKGRHSGELILVQYHDTDEELVLIGLSKNEYGELFDLDFWKVTFNPLIRYPKPEDLKQLEM
jgi:hypothetical protein